MDRFKVRLNCVDHYQASPTSLDPPLFGQKSRVSQQNAPLVPVIRVFGATETGQRVLMHIHGAFQYTYIEYAGSLLPQDVEVAIQSLHLSIDHALAVSYRKNIYEGKHRVDRYIQDELKLYSAVFVFTGNFYENMVLRGHVKVVDGGWGIEFRQPIIKETSKCTYVCWDGGLCVCL